MIIHDLERNDVEIAIGKLNEISKILSKLAANSVDSDFVATMDVAGGDVDNFAQSLRTTLELAKMIDFQEYHERYLRD